MTATESDASPLPAVLFITRAYPPIRGGMERFSVDLTTEIAARTRTRVIANRSGKRFLPLFFLTTLLRAPFMVRGYNIIHLGDPVLSVFAHILKRCTNEPIVMNVHGLDILYASPLYQKYLNRYFGAPDIYVCISNHVEWLVKQRLPKAKTIVITPGVRDELYEAGRTRADVSPLLNEDVANRQVLLTVGRLIPRKGVAWFVHNVLPLLPDTVLYCVVGDGPDMGAIRAAAKEHNVEHKLRLLGGLPRENVKLLYNTSDLFIMPNIPTENDAEGFGLVALEAATCKLPVVAAATEGIVDAVYDGENGLLAESQNPDSFVERIMELLQNPDRRKQLGENARRFTLTRFSWNRIAREYLELFERVEHV